jgi:hypothetical protein
LGAIDYELEDLDVKLAALRFRVAELEADRAGLEVQRAEIEKERDAYVVRREAAGMSDWHAYVEAHLRRVHQPDGKCFHCRRPANRYHPIGPLKISINEPDDGDQHWVREFCEWRCLACWAAEQAAGVFIVDRC